MPGGTTCCCVERVGRVRGVGCNENCLAVYSVNGRLQPEGFPRRIYNAVLAVRGGSGLVETSLHPKIRMCVAL